MKIRRKISIIYMLVTTFVLICFSLFVYLFSDHYVRSDFFERLEEKAYFIADKYFEEDEMSHKLYTEIMEKNSKSLPEATEIVLDVKNPVKVHDSLMKVLPPEVVSRLMAGHEAMFSINEKQGVGLYYPDNQGTFIIVVTAVDKIGIRKQQNLLKSLVGILLVSIIFIYFIGQFYARQVLLPINHILKEVTRIRAKNLKHRLAESPGTDELSELIRMFNQMLERLEHAFDMQKNFINNASHELKNPITAIMGETEVALSKTRSVEDYITTLRKINAEADRLDIITRDLLNLARADFEITEQNREKIRIDEILGEINELFEKGPNRNRLQLHIEPVPGQPDYYVVHGIRYLLHTAFANLIDNACKFSNGQKVEVFLKKNMESVNVLVSDKGIGIPENEQKGLLQPFFRATNAYSYKGSGIGLSFANKIIRLHNGTLNIHSDPGMGTTVEVQLSATPDFDTFFAQKS